MIRKLSILGLEEWVAGENMHVKKIERKPVINTSRLRFLITHHDGKSITIEAPSGGVVVEETSE